jgi:MerR family transcriptional regulator, thiopeptide resistance regulator
LQDVQRLQQIRTLQGLGLSLAEIANELAHPTSDAASQLQRYITKIDVRIAEQQKLKMQLETVAKLQKAGETPSLEEILNTLETMKMMEKYYTAEQMSEMKKREQTIGPERIAVVQARWPVLIAAVKERMAKGTPANDPNVKTLAREWMDLVNEMTGGDDGIRKSIMDMYKAESPKAEPNSMFDPDMPKMFIYIQQAMQA